MYRTKTSCCTSDSLGFHCGIAGSLLGGLASKPGQPGSVALGSARIARDADSLAGEQVTFVGAVPVGGASALLEIVPVRLVVEGRVK